MNSSGALYALLATAIWSGNFIVARSLGDSFPPACLAFLRWATAFVFLLPVVPGVLRDSRQILRRHLGYLTLTALIGVTVFNTLIYIAGRYTPALNMALIATASPVFMLIISRLAFGDPVTPRRAAGLSAALFGAALLVTRGDLSLLRDLDFNSGDLWMLGAAVCFALYSILVRRKPPEIGQKEFLVSTFGLGLILLAPWAAADYAASGGVSITPAAAGAVLYIGLGASLVSFFCWNKAIEHIGPARAGIIYYTLPAFSGAEAALLLGEPVSWVHAVSGMFIIGGIYLATRD